jgi:peptidoglycan-N-acetylglucosamine deacetylase
LPNSMPKPTTVTTSWDDGDVADLRIAEILKARGLGGTFYVPFAGPGGRVTLRTHQMRSMWSEGFEIGAHTLSHCTLTRVSPDQSRTEILACKRVLEDLLGDEVGMFCYPRGRFDATALAAVREAGYRGARTTRLLTVEATFPSFEMPTTVQAFPHRPGNYIRNLARRRQWSSLSYYYRELRRYPHWVQLGKKLFDDALAVGGVWHLWGHSWEVEALDLWTELEELLDYVSNRPGVLYANNGETLNRVSSWHGTPALANPV